MSAAGVYGLEWHFESADQIYASMMHTELMLHLRGEGAADSDFDAAELIYGELISNLIRHATGKVTIRLDWTAESPTLSVCDEGRYIAPSISLPSDPYAESGRGLYIVKSLARDFAVIDGEKTGSSANATLPVKRKTS